MVSTSGATSPTPRVDPNETRNEMSARTALGWVAAIVALELLLVILLPFAKGLADIGVAWYEPLRRVAPVASMLPEGQSLGARTLMLAFGLALVPIKAIFVAVAGVRARESLDMQDLVNLPSNRRVAVTSRVASGLLLTALAAMLLFFVLGYFLSSGSERSAIFVILRTGGFKYWLVWHLEFFTLLSGVLGLCAAWAWDALRMIRG